MSLYSIYNTVIIENLNSSSSENETNVASDFVTSLQAEWKILKLNIQYRNKRRNLASSHKFACTFSDIIYYLSNFCPLSHPHRD